MSYEWFELEERGIYCSWAKFHLVNWWTWQIIRMGIPNLWLHWCLFTEYCLDVFGISNHMAQSVLQQYLTTCSSLGFQPKIVQSDCGKETLLCAEVHFAFACMMQEDPNFKVGDCWFYGTSTGNQQIESWWAQLEKSQLYHWRVCFYHITFLYELIGYRSTFRALQKVANLRKTT